MYKLTNDEDLVQHKESGAFIPKGNERWALYEAWLAAGNVPEPEEIVERVTSISMRQARLQLHTMGLLQTVSDAIAAMEGAEGEVARIEWAANPPVERSNPTTLAMMSMLGFDEVQADLFFEEAGRL